MGDGCRPNLLQEGALKRSLVAVIGATSLMGCYLSYFHLNAAAAALGATWQVDAEVGLGRGLRQPHTRPLIRCRPSLFWSICHPPRVSPSSVLFNFSPPFCFGFLALSCALNEFLAFDSFFWAFRDVFTLLCPGQLITCPSCHPAQFWSISYTTTFRSRGWGQVAKLDGGSERGCLLQLGSRQRNGQDEGHSRGWCCNDRCKR